MQFGNNNKPFVAIWMVTYNHGVFIEQAIESVMAQKTNFEYKLFIGEDCSTDSTSKICQQLKEKYPNKIELFLNEKNLGGTQNAIQIYKECFESDAKYIALLEGDDYWTNPLKLQKQVDFLEKNTDYVLCFHQVDILKASGEIVEDFITKVPENHENIETLARLGNYIHTPSVVFRNIISEFPFEFEQSPIGDFFLYMILAEHGKLKYMDEKMAVYRYGVGVFSGKTALKIVKSNLKLFTCLLSYINDERIKKIIFERQLQTVAYLEYIIANKYKGFFVSNHILFKIIKFMQENYRRPHKILNKIISKLFKVN